MTSLETGGGFLENIPRILPEGVSVKINRGSWPELPVFGLMQKLGNVSDKEMFRTFNMGIGIVVVVAQGEADSVAHTLGAFNVGKVANGSGTVKIV